MICSASAEHECRGHGTSPVPGEPPPAWSGKPARMAFRQLEPAPGRYGALLLLLIVSYLLSAFLPIGRWVEGLQVVLFSVVGLLALRSSTVPRRAVRVLLI